jgi:endonuclease YncB( thermonuclease family)
MKAPLRRAVLAALVALPLMWPPVLHADTMQDSGRLLTGTVVKVLDGDTILVQLGKKRVRLHLAGIDAPETGQPWGKEAKAALEQLVLNQSIDLQPLQQDKRNRRTAIVFVGEQEIGATMVGDGNAWADRASLRRSDSGLCESEANAREGRRGLWALSAEQRVAPWEYRRRFLHRHFTDYSHETVAQCVAASGKG